MTWDDYTQRKRTKNGKIRQRSDKEDRTLVYRNWRWETPDKGCYVNDVDQVEWRIKNGHITPVATLELSRVDGDSPLPQSYLDNVIKRYNSDAQGKISRLVAEKLGVMCFLVLFRRDLSEFYVWNLSVPRNKWWILNQKEYENWLRNL